jgi:putative ABC transport system substrate-binding protein
MKSMVYILVVVSLALGLVSSIKWLTTNTLPSVEIGILQTASHPALDQVRAGFVETMQKELPSIVFTTHNAEGSMSQARTAANQFHSKPNIKLIFTIGTLASQAALQADSSKPIVYAAVSDPKMLPTHDAKVLGVSDQIDMAKQVELIKKLLPNIRKVGVILNPSEPNSLTQSSAAKHLLGEAKIGYSEHAVYNASDLSMVARQAFQNNDLVLCPTDNTIAANMALIGRMALQERKALLMSHTPIEPGALWAMGVDYRLHGTDAARLALQQISANDSGSSPQNMGPGTANSGTSKPSVIVSKSTASALGLDISSVPSLDARWVD